MPVLATDTARTAPGDPGPARGTAIGRLIARGPFSPGAAFGLTHPGCCGAPGMSVTSVARWATKVTRQQGHPILHTHAFARRTCSFGRVARVCMVNRVVGRSCRARADLSARGYRRGAVRRDDRHRVGSGAEPGLGRPDHRDAERGVRVRAQAGTAAGIQVGAAIDDQQAQPAQTVQDRVQRRERAGRTLLADRAVRGGLRRCVRLGRARDR